MALLGIHQTIKNIKNLHEVIQKIEVFLNSFPTALFWYPNLTQALYYKQQANVFHEHTFKKNP